MRGLSPNSATAAALSLADAYHAPEVAVMDTPEAAHAAFMTLFGGGRPGKPVPKPS